MRVRASTLPPPRGRRAEARSDPCAARLANSMRPSVCPGTNTRSADMTTIGVVETATASELRASVRPSRATGLAWALVAASAWLVSGVYLDGWAHQHGKVDDTFFTAWHAVLYSGYGATAGVLLAAV